MSNNPCYVLVTPRHNPTNYTNSTNLTHCQTTSRQLDATRPTQQPANLSSRSTQLTQLTARQHLDSSTRLDQRNNRLIYQVDQPNLPNSLPDNISTARRDSTNATAGLFIK